MKTFTTNLFLTLAAALLIVGCATTETKIGDASGWRKDKDLQRVWLAPSFDFNGYDGIYIEETKYAAKERPNEVEMRAWAKKYLRDALSGAIPESGVIRATYLSTNEIPAGAKVLKLENTIYDYEKGGGAARYFAGLSGAGQPLLKVRGVLTYNDEPMFRYEASRSGESANARMLGGVLSLSNTDKSIQTQDINDLATDFADFIRRTAKHTNK